jgi:transposase
MQKVVLLLTFWFTPPTEEKYQYWIDFVGDDAELDEEGILDLIADVTCDGDTWVKWSALDPFVEETNKNMH